MDPSNGLSRAPGAEVNAESMLNAAALLGDGYSGGATGSSSARVTAGFAATFDLPGCSCSEARRACLGALSFEFSYAAGEP